MANVIKPDIAFKNFWTNPHRFADLFNQALFNGKAVIDPNGLSDHDITESSLLADKDLMKFTSISSERDVIKHYTDGTEFILLGIENQMKVHYAMPVRIMMYRSLRYANQCKAIENRHRAENDLSTGDEFLSGFTKDDKLTPVITLVLYYGEKEWDGPLKLTDMMDVPPLFKDFVNDESIFVLPVRQAGTVEFQDKDNNDFFTTLAEIYNSEGILDKEVFKTKYSDKKLYWETLAAIGAATGSMEIVNYAQKQKGVDQPMWVALENLKLEGEKIGKREGEKIGIKKGEKIGIKKGEKNLVKIMFDKGRTIEEIAELTNIPSETLNEYLHA
jgi:hypothetical protein